MPLHTLVQHTHTFFENVFLGQFRVDMPADDIRFTFARVTPVRGRAPEEDTLGLIPSGVEKAPIPPAISGAAKWFRRYMACCRILSRDQDDQ